MNESWGVSLGWVRESEGGNDDDPLDPGGRTSRGITQAEYDSYCALKDLQQGDVWNAPDLFINDIYLRYYWQPYADVFPVPIDYMWFDAAVNHGPVRATITLQRALKIKDDGHIGAVTMNAVLKADIRPLIDMVDLRRRTFYRQIRTFRRFGEGWLKRASFVRKNALGMIEGS